MAGMQIKFHCKGCGQGLFTQEGTGKIKGFLGHKGQKWVCCYCKHPHLVDDAGRLLGSGDEVK